MKLAEALIIRADLQTRISELQTRAEENTKVQQGDNPILDPMKIISQINEAITQLETIVVKINTSNLQVHLPDGRSMTEALARRDHLRMRWNSLKKIVDSANESVSRYSLSEIKMITVVDVAGLQTQMDELAMQRRQLDIQIQATNWTSDLL